jgi:hypothetical protein
VVKYAWWQDGTLGMVDQMRKILLGSVATVGVFAALALMPWASCFAQSNVRQFYGHGDYGANGNYPYYPSYPTPGRTEIIEVPVYVVPVPIQPSRIVCRSEIIRETERIVGIECSQDGQVVRYCRKNEPECYENELWDPKPHYSSVK